jgi:predicted phosphodiesterase
MAAYPVIKTDDGSIKILQLTDLHYRNLGSFGAKFGVNYILDSYLKMQIKALVKSIEPDLIIITGDLITFPAADIAYTRLASFFGSLSIPWTVAFGNHDGEYNSDKIVLSKILEDGAFSYFKTGPNNIEGVGNQVIGVVDNDNKLSQAVIILDTNDEVKKIMPDRIGASYEVGIYPSQIEWYEWVTDGLNALNGAILPAQIFCHINPDEFPIPPTEFKDLLMTQQNTGFIFFGHTHSGGEFYSGSDTIVHVNGVKTGINYLDNGNTTGGTKIILMPDGSAEIELLSVSIFGIESLKHKTFNES